MLVHVTKPSEEVVMAVVGAHLELDPDGAGDLEGLPERRAGVGEDVGALLMLGVVEDRPPRGERGPGDRWSGSGRDRR